MRDRGQNQSRLARGGNLPWISVVADGAPVNVDLINVQANRFSSIPEYWGRPDWEIRCLYSRRGQLYRPYIFYPKLSWPDFISWLVTE